MKYGTIGTGWITQAFIDSANTMNNFELAGVYSRDILRARKFAAKNNCAVAYDDLERLATRDIDLVYIASPNSLHYKQCRLFLENGKHVICEKPAVVYPDEARELYHIADKNHVIFLEAIIMLHQPQFHTVKTSLKKIGPILSARLDYSQYSAKYQKYLEGENPNVFNPKFASGCMMNLGVYIIYTALGLFGRPDELFTQAQLLDSGADISFCSIYRYPDKLVTLTSSKAGQSYLGSEIMGTLGTMTFGLVSNFTDITIHYNNGTTERIADDVPRLTLMANEIRDLIRYIEKPEETYHEYTYIRELCIAVSEVTAQMRRQAGIIFSA
ncbi:MAG: Gfo/Idh/MocA family oxidoreductase [Christensenella hongkongensis]|uniref:Gfo/Idh/MocA family protein n=1 Tax=Christensenella hongkongensis TaxID=270498 RepID=UPI002A752F7B|nr:Gfo/Idh/MocA family oxidoreductase [Christensenella hongkongensis]MDY3004082.1 Gfo/Idh/MocA family oxidoreductase [Christensenella hongkongensis]